VTSYSTLIQYMDLSTTFWPLKTTSSLVGFFFKMAAAAIIDFFKFRNVKGWKGQEGQCASPCQISFGSVKPLLRYIHAPKIGVLPEKWELGPHLTVSPGPRPTSIPSDIMIHIQPFGHNEHGPQLMRTQANCKSGRADVPLSVMGSWVSI